MSQSIPVAGPSQPHSDGSSLHYHRCWWAWCCHNFYTRSDLLNHITFEHVQKARAERLRDISHHRMAEDDYWNSQEPHLSLPAIPSSLNSANPLLPEDVLSGGKTIELIPSSLPSPPASTPNDIPGTPTSPRKSTDLPADRDSLAIHLQNDGLTQNHYSTSSQSPSPQRITSPEFRNALLTPPSKKRRLDMSASTTSFISLSSQFNSPSTNVYPVPDSPSFESLVEDATRSSDSRHSSLFRETTDEQDEDFLSRSEGSSQEFVLKQLTQRTDEEEADHMVEVETPNIVENIHEGSMGTSFGNQSASSLGGYEDRLESNPERVKGGNMLTLQLNPINSTPAQAQQVQQHQTPPLASLYRVQPESPSFLYSPTYSVGSPAIPVRQNWYQAPPRRKSSKRAKISESRLEQVDDLKRAITSPPPPTPNVGGSVFQSTSSTASSPSTPTSDSSQYRRDTASQTQQNISPTLADSQIPYSYPPLQTQAPYQSQSMSQD